MLSPFEFILIMCATTGAMMVFGSIVLLYRGAIKLTEKGLDRAIEAEFKNQLKLNVRNPALGLFVIGLAFFGLALYFGKPERGPLVVTGHINIPEGATVRLKAEEWRIDLSSDGNFSTTIQPLEKLAIVLEAPDYNPPRWYHQINPDEARNGRIKIEFPEFKFAAGATLTKPKLDSTPEATSLFGLMIKR